MILMKSQQTGSRLAGTHEWRSDWTVSQTIINASEVTTVWIYRNSIIIIIIIIINAASNRCIRYHFD